MIPRTNLLKQIGEGVYKAASRFKEMCKIHPNRIDQIREQRRLQYLHLAVMERRSSTARRTSSLAASMGSLAPPNLIFFEKIERSTATKKTRGLSS